MSAIAWKSRAAEAPLGILVLDTRFPRIPGDVGCPETWPFPVLLRRVAGATPDRVVAGGADGLIDRFVAAGLALAEAGAAGIVTTCGFLVLRQGEFRARLPVPVMTSSLLQIPTLARLLPPGRVPGIVTVDAGALTPAHLAEAGAPANLPVGGTPPGSHFAGVFLRDRTDLDPEEARRDVVSAATELVRSRPEVGALVLECANMGPYTAAVRRATGLPVFDAVSAATWFRAGLAPRAFGEAA